MESIAATGSYIYTIDRENRIVTVSDNWLLFAQENQAAESCHPGMIISKPIWDYIDGMETKHIYAAILNNVRIKSRAITLPFRCDAPDKRRYLELIITPIQEGGIEFVSHVIHEETRDTVELLEAGMPRSREFINMCSMCRKVELPGNLWAEVEAAVIALNLFATVKLPQISHGICPDCFKAAMVEIEKLSS